MVFGLPEIAKMKRPSPVSVASVADGSARDAEVLIQYGASSIWRPQTSDTSLIQPSDAPAGGCGALHAVAKALREESAILGGGLLPGLRLAEFCENGATAVA